MKANFSFIQKILVLYVIVWTIAPPLQIDLIYRIAALGAIGLWFILNLPQNVSFEKIHIYGIMFVLLIIIVNLMESKGDFANLLKPINYYLLVIAFMMAHAYKDRWDELSSLIPVVLVLLIVFNIKTFQVVLEDPAVARLIVRNDPSIYPYMRSGVGGYSLLYSQVCIFPVIVSWILSVFKKSMLKFIVGVAWLASYALYLLNSGYTIALVTSVVSLIILFLYRQRSIVMAVVVTAIIVVSMVWLISYNDGFRNGLLAFFDGTTVAKKVNDIHLSITTENAADSILIRMNAYGASISTALNYPLIGSLWWTSGGGHSALIDTLAKYGIFGMLIYIKIVFELPLRIKKSPPTGKDTRIANALFISLLMVLLLDSMPYNFVMLIVFVVPICYNDILNWRKTDENTLDSKSDTGRRLTKVKN